MALLKFQADKCILCGICIEKCPFQALSMEADGIHVNEKCRMCGICVKGCPEHAIQFEQKARSVDKKKWNDILVYGEISDGDIHPVVYELIGEGRKLAEKAGYCVNVILVGADDTKKLAEKLIPYGVYGVYTYEHPGFLGFKADCYADAVADCISAIRPSVVLIGATPLGRSLAPRLSTRFHTGLTADCTQLQMKENTDLVQIRPAFGGNIMAQILITNFRPQFATVRYKVMDRAKKVENPNGRVVPMEVTDALAKSAIQVTDIQVIARTKSIEEEEVLVVAGRGVKTEKDVEMVRQLATLLGGQLCFTRPMVEKGFGDTAHQIGLSGRTVKPKLIITCGVSGAIQFTACMNGADRIVAINSDPDALIFKIADYCVVDDLYQVIPRLIENIKKAGGTD